MKPFGCNTQGRAGEMHGGLESPGSLVDDLDVALAEAAPPPSCSTTPRHHHHQPSDRLERLERPDKPSPGYGGRRSQHDSNSSLSLTPVSGRPAGHMHSLSQPQSQKPFKRRTQSQGPPPKRRANEDFTSDDW